MTEENKASPVTTTPQTTDVEQPRHIALQKKILQDFTPSPLVGKSTVAATTITFKASILNPVVSAPTATATAYQPDAAMTVV